VLTLRILCQILQLHDCNQSLTIQKLILVIDDLAAQWVHTRPINPSPDTEETYTLIQSWISNCIRSHCHKNIADSSFTPSRLLKIVEMDGKFDLTVVQAGTHAPYVALSYCWGGNQEHKTTTKSLKENRGVIDYNNLPKSIRDAINITAKLRYNYLWVDSMCIIQDDDVDKSREIAQMPFIYSNALFTIAASSAAAARDGFLRKRRETACGEMFEFLFLGAGNQIGRLRGVHVPEDEYGKAPLNARGWCLQERLLSTRILEYDCRQLRWICPDSGGQNRYTDGWSKSAEAIFPHINYIPSTLPEADFRETWRDIVIQYSRRNLTMASDRILAISGIANRFGNLTDDTYIAGHWLSMLPGNLLWYADYYGYTETKTFGPRTGVYQGPTWSWVAIDCDILWDLPALDDSWQNTLEILNYGIQLQDESALYGAVTDAVLTVKGPIKSAWCMERPYDKPSRMEITQTKVGPGIAMVHLDAHELGIHENYDKGPVYLLAVSSKERSQDDRFTYGLVLKEELSANVVKRYSRLGTFSLTPSFPSDSITDVLEKRRLLGLFDDCKKYVIELI